MFINTKIVSNFFYLRTFFIDGIKNLLAKKLGDKLIWSNEVRIIFMGIISGPKVLWRRR
jgi:hypothetical protein